MSLRSPGRGKCDGRTLETNGTAWHSILQLTEPQRSQRASEGPRAAGTPGQRCQAHAVTPPTLGQARRLSGTQFLCTVPVDENSADLG